MQENYGGPPKFQNTKMEGTKGTTDRIKVKKNLKKEWWE